MFNSAKKSWLAFAVVFLITALSYQNCSGPNFSSQADSKLAKAGNGNGDNYDGKLYVISVGAGQLCADGSNIKSSIVVGARIFQLRRDCIALNPPVELAATAVAIDSVNGTLSYQGEIYTDATAPAATPTPAPTPDPAVMATKLKCAYLQSSAQPSGSFACYGIFDTGATFGTDSDVCGSLVSPQTGCVVSTPNCSSGSATATSYLAMPSYGGANGLPIATAAQVQSLANQFGVSVSYMDNANIIWTYTCQ